MVAMVSSGKMEIRPLYFLADVAFKTAKSVADTNGDTYCTEMLDQDFKHASIQLIRKLKISKEHQHDWIMSLKVTESHDNTVDSEKSLPKTPFLVFFSWCSRNLQRLYLGTMDIERISALEDLLWGSQPDPKTLTRTDCMAFGMLSIWSHSTDPRHHRM